MTSPTPIRSISGLVVLPYALHTNEMKFFHPNGVARAGEMVDYVDNALETLLYEAEAGRTRLLNIGFHLRVAGSQPASPHPPPPRWARRRGVGRNMGGDRAGLEAPLRLAAAYRRASGAAVGVREWLVAQGVVVAPVERPDERDDTRTHRAALLRRRREGLREARGDLGEECPFVNLHEAAVIGRRDHARGMARRIQRIARKTASGKAPTVFRKPALSHLTV